MGGYGRSVPDVVFVGVSTGQSLVHRVWPVWQPLLGTTCGVRGTDLGLGVGDEDYVGLLERLRNDESAAGAVITAHKVRVYAAGEACFARLDPLSLACREVNAIRRTTGGLWGWARDPISVGRVVDRIWPSREGQVVCLGAGGTARALAHHLAARAEVEFVCADRDPAAVGELVRRLAGRAVGHVGEGPWDDLVGSAPPGSLVVNATGMGKDRPGTPISDGARFPPAPWCGSSTTGGSSSSSGRPAARPTRPGSRSTTAGSSSATVGPRPSPSSSTSPTRPISATA